MFDIPSTYPIETWGEVFRDFREVESVKVVTSALRLDISIAGRDNILQLSQERLDDTLYKFKGNPREVAAYVLREEGIIVIYEDTLVGYFDIVGYSSYIDKCDSIENCIWELDKLFEKTKGNSEADILGLKFNHWVLSDSIIVVIDTIRNPLFGGSIEGFLAMCSFLMRTAMFNNFPLRGAIGGGNFYKDGELMVSSALVDAAYYERKQNWLGAVITPSAVELINKAKEADIKDKRRNIADLKGDLFKEIVGYGKIPWKVESGMPNDDMHYIKYPPPYLKWEDNLPDYFDKVGKRDMLDNTHRLFEESRRPV